MKADEVRCDEGRRDEGRSAVPSIDHCKDMKQKASVPASAR